MVTSLSANQRPVSNGHMITLSQSEAYCVKEGANDPCQQDISRLLQLQYSISCPIFCFTVFTSLLRGWRIVPTLNLLARLVIWSYSPGDASSNPLFRSVVKCVDEVCAGCCQMNSLLFVAFILPGNVTAIHIWNKCWRSWVINWIWILISWTTLNREQFELWIHFELFNTSYFHFIRFNTYRWHFSRVSCHPFSW